MELLQGIRFVVLSSLLISLSHPRDCHLFNAAMNHSFDAWSKGALRNRSETFCKAECMKDTDLNESKPLLLTPA